MDWINCNSCCQQPGDERERSFVLTNCGHIFCDLCVAKAGANKCSTCNNKCQTMQLSSKMKPDAEMFFLEPEELLKRQYSQLNRLLAFQKEHRARLVSFHRRNEGPRISPGRLSLIKAGQSVNRSGHSPNEKSPILDHMQGLGACIMNPPKMPLATQGMAHGNVFQNVHGSFYSGFSSPSNSGHYSPHHPGNTKDHFKASTPSGMGNYRNHRPVQISSPSSTRSVSNPVSRLGPPGQQQVGCKPYQYPSFCSPPNNVTSSYPDLRSQQQLQARASGPSMSK